MDEKIKCCSEAFSYDVIQLPFEGRWTIICQCDNPDHWQPNVQLAGSYPTLAAARVEMDKLNGISAAALKFDDEPWGEWKRP